MKQLFERVVTVLVILTSIAIVASGLPLSISGSGSGHWSLLPLVH
jgi:hypothetical protein